MGLEGGELVAVDLLEHRDLVRAPARRHVFDALLEAARLLGVEPHQVGDAHHVTVPDELRRDVDVVRGPIAGDDPAARVGDDAASGRQLDRLGDVLFGDARVVLVLERLELNHPAGQHQKDDEHHQRHPLVALLELADLATLGQEVHWLRRGGFFLATASREGLDSPNGGEDEW